jgi:hypothetical protein
MFMPQKRVGVVSLEWSGTVKHFKILLNIKILPHWQTLYNLWHVRQKLFIGFLRIGVRRSLENFCKNKFNLCKVPVRCQMKWHIILVKSWASRHKWIGRQAWDVNDSWGLFIMGLSRNFVPRRNIWAYKTETLSLGRNFVSRRNLWAYKTETLSLGRFLTLGRHRMWLGSNFS